MTDNQPVNPPPDNKNASPEDQPTTAQAKEQPEFKQPDILPPDETKTDPHMEAAIAAIFALPLRVRNELRRRAG